MSTTTSSIDLSLLPPPQAVEQISFEAIYEELMASFLVAAPDYQTTSEADMVPKVLQICAYREMMLRQRENTKTKALMLAFAEGADLDHIGATYYNGATRLVVQAADNTVTPPLAQILENDDDFRRRLLLQPEGQSVAGPEDAYVFHSLSADGGVSDASAYSPWPAGVVVSILGRNGQAPAASVLQAVATTLRAAVVLTTSDAAVPRANELNTPADFTSGGLRPVADRVIVRPATLVPYTIEADVVTPTGPDTSVIAAAIAANLTAYKDAPRRLGRDTARSAIFAAIHVAGVERVTLLKPSADVTLTVEQAAVCASITVRINGVAIAI